MKRCLRLLLPLVAVLIGFVEWLNGKRTSRKKILRDNKKQLTKVSREMFLMVDEDHSGFIEKDEYQPSLLDFRSALERTHQQKKIIRSLQNVLQRRLLHPGANTSQIIDIYVATIKTLRILDPTGILLESIACLPECNSTFNRIDGTSMSL